MLLLLLQQQLLLLLLYCHSCFSFALVFYVVAVAVVMVLDLWFLGDVHMNEVRIIGFFIGKVGILGGNLGYPIKPESGS